MRSLVIFLLAICVVTFVESIVCQKSRKIGPVELEERESIRIGNGMPEIFHRLDSKFASWRRLLEEEGGTKDKENLNIPGQMVKKLEVGEDKGESDESKEKKEKSESVAVVRKDEARSEDNEKLIKDQPKKAETEEKEMLEIDGAEDGKQDRELDKEKILVTEPKEKAGSIERIELEEKRDEQSEQTKEEPQRGTVEDLKAEKVTKQIINEKGEEGGDADSEGKKVEQKGQREEDRNSDEVRVKQKDEPNVLEKKRDGNQGDGTEQEQKTEEKRDNKQDATEEENAGKKSETITRKGTVEEKNIGGKPDIKSDPVVKEVESEEKREAKEVHEDEVKIAGETQSEQEKETRDEKEETQEDGKQGIELNGKSSELEKKVDEVEEIEAKQEDGKLEQEIEHKEERSDMEKKVEDTHQEDGKIEVSELEKKVEEVEEKDERQEDGKAEQEVKLKEEMSELEKKGGKVEEGEEKQEDGKIEEEIELKEEKSELEKKVEVQLEDVKTDDRVSAESLDLDVTERGTLSSQPQDVENDEYGDFVQEFADLPFKFQETAEKVASHLRPDLQRLTDKSKAYFNIANAQITESFSPLIGRQYAPFIASFISYGLLLLPLVIVIFLFEHVRALLSLEKVLLFINIYLAAYFSTLLLASFIIGTEPMAFFHKNALSSYIYLQLLQALGYIVYLILQSFNVVGSCSSDSIAAKLTAPLQWIVAVLVGLHYYITVFHRAMATQPPRTSWKICGIYSLAFFILCLFARIKRRKKDYIHVGDATTDKKN